MDPRGFLGLLGVSILFFLLSFEALEPCNNFKPSRSPKISATSGFGARGSHVHREKIDSQNVTTLEIFLDDREGL